MSIVQCPTNLHDFLMTMITDSCSGSSSARGGGGGFEESEVRALFDTGFKWAASQGHADIICRMIDESCVDPSMDNDFALRVAARHGYVDIVRRLLDCAAVDPAAGESQALRYAARWGHLDVVVSLLADDRRAADPCAVKNYAFRWAAKNRHREVMDVLVADGRVIGRTWCYMSLYIAENEEYTEMVAYIKEHMSAEYSYGMEHALMIGNVYITLADLTDLTHSELAVEYKPTNIILTQPPQGPLYDNECPICLGCEDGGTINAICGHRYHKECMEKYMLQSNYQCALCRKHIICTK